jgi:hypothetical protein
MIRLVFITLAIISVVATIVVVIIITKNNKKCSDDKDCKNNEICDPQTKKCVVKSKMISALEQYETCDCENGSKCDDLGNCVCLGNWTGDKCDKCEGPSSGDKCEICEGPWTGDKCDKCSKYAKVDPQTGKCVFGPILCRPNKTATSKETGTKYFVTNCNQVYTSPVLVGHLNSNDIGDPQQFMNPPGTNKTGLFETDNFDGENIVWNKFDSRQTETWVVS